MFDKIIDDMQEEFIASTKEILKIKSVKGAKKLGMPFGDGPTNALESVLNLAKGMGFKTCNMDNYIGWAEFGEGDEMVAILGHLDVVPEGDGWIYPPYAAEIHDGKIYARGTLDDKAPMMAALFAIKAVAESKKSLSKRVRIIFGLDEESNWDDISHYKKCNAEVPSIGFTPDGNFPIINAEKGILTFNLSKKLSNNNILKINGGQRANIVPDSCTVTLDFGQANKNLVNDLETFATKHNFDMKARFNGTSLEIDSKGISAHGSNPHLGKNAIAQVLAFLADLQIENEELKSYIDFISSKIGFETDGTSLNINLCDDASGKLTLNLGILNLTEHKASTTLNLRVPVTFNPNDIAEKIKNTASNFGISMEDLEIQKPLHVPANSFLIETLQKVYSEKTGKEATLLAIGGGTYAKAFNNIVAFGPIFPNEPDLDHQANEYIKIENLLLMSKIYANAIYELAK